MSTLKAIDFLFPDTISGLDNPLINRIPIYSTISSKHKFSNGEMKYNCPGKITDNGMEMEKRGMQNKKTHRCT